LRPKNGNIDYYTYLLESIDYTIWVTGSAQPKLTADNLANIEIIEPPSNEQDEIVEYVKSHCTIVEGIVSKIYSDIRLLQEYRTALISEAVIGKIDVRDIDILD
jgi:type I restriction enzyme S subunit